MLYDLSADVLAGDEILDRGSDKVHELRDVSLLQVIRDLEGPLM